MANDFLVLSFIPTNASTLSSSLSLPFSFRLSQTTYWCLGVYMEMLVALSLLILLKGSLLPFAFHGSFSKLQIFPGAWSLALPSRNGPDRTGPLFCFHSLFLVPMTSVIF